MYADLALLDGLEPHIRQSAAVLLKRYVKHHWSSKADDFRPIEPDEQHKSYIRGRLVQARTHTHMHMCTHARTCARTRTHVRPRTGTAVPTVPGSY